MSTRKKLLIFSSSFQVFGAETFMLNVINYIQQTNAFDMHVVINGWSDGQFENKLKEIGISSYTALKLGWIYLTKPLWTIDSFVHYPRAYAQFLKLYKSFSPDVIFTNSYNYIVLLYPFLHAPVVFNVQDQQSADWKARWLLPRIDAKVKYYWAASDFIKRDLVQIRISPQKVITIHNSLNLAEHLSEHQTSITKPQLVIGIVGQIIPRKGQHVLIEALSRLKAKGHAFLCEIWGRGQQDYMAQLKQQIKEYGLETWICWKGYELNRSIIYQNLDILVAPTTYPEEAFGLVLIEAMARKIPVVASKGGAFPEIIDHGTNGLLFPVGDAEALAQCLIKLISDPDLRLRMGEMGYEKVKNHFSIEKKLPEAIRLINQAAEDRKK